LWRQFNAQPSLLSINSAKSDLSADEDFLESDIPPFYRAIYDYKATQDDDLSLKVCCPAGSKICLALTLIFIPLSLRACQAGEVVYVLVVRDDGWCQGMNTKFILGYFPQSYVLFLFFLFLFLFFFVFFLCL
jgi:hypothetical protein